jgi:hypothetical protein
MLTTILALAVVGQAGELQKEVAGWKPTAEDRVVPPAKLWVKDVDWAGRWSSVRGGSQVFVKRLGRGKYLVEVVRMDCVSADTFCSGATEENGALKLDKPAWMIAPFDRLYAVKFFGKPRLVSPRNWTDLSDELDSRVAISILSCGKHEPPKIRQTVPPDDF